MKTALKQTRLFVAILMMFSLLLAACSGGNGNQPPAEGSKESAGETASSKSNDELKPYEIVMVFAAGSEPKDLQLVQDEISKITKEKMNATVKLVPINYGAWVQQTMLMLSGNEKVDVILSGLGTYSQDVAKGYYLPLDDLIAQYGQGAKEALDAQDPQFLDAAKIEGKLYGIPGVKDLADEYGFTIRKDLVDKYKLDLSAVKSLDDLDPILQTIKDNEPNMAPMTRYGNSLLDTISPAYMDPLGEGFGVLPNHDNGLQVVNWFETPEYAQLLNTVRRWYTAGFIHKDIVTTTEYGPALVKAGKAASYLQHMKPGIEQQESRMTAHEMVSIRLKPAVATTGKIQRVLWSIPNNAKNPERSMMFINLLFTDKQIVDLLDWGVEGKHYVKVADNVIDYPEGVDAANTGYGLNQGWMFGNQFLSYVWNGTDSTIYEQMSKFNQDAIKSKALGFSFNAENVKTEIASVTNVQNQFKNALETGTVDPATQLPEFIKQLKAAGIEKIIDEKQKQLDEWAKQ
ncbi:ABC transporter substrate-binding protein [Paenibacillus thermotolerans]|uniref:ABC transporter substrate-binding protein n=1 Tax=Paenibacillus thermotolerans TaxID=3027807 RepID=UPI002367CF41|nr:MULTISPECIES: ABC transporter substrate-binding protein [unclassified Paenibacillus]